MFIYLPSNKTNIFYENITPVNIFRVLFNNYFGTDLEILEDRSFFSKDGYYDLIDVTDILRNT